MEWIEHLFILVLRSLFWLAHWFLLQKSHAYSMEIDVTFRQSLLKLKMHFRILTNTKSVFRLQMFFLSRTGIIFLQLPHSIIFYLARNWSKDDVTALQGLLLRHKNFLWNQYQHDLRKIILLFAQLSSLFFRGRKIYWCINSYH